MNAEIDLDVSVAGVADKPIVARLVQLCLHDFSEFASVGSPFGDVDADGRFEMRSFDSYWNERGRMALIFRVEGQFAGFAMVNTWSPSGAPVDHSMAEFFVMRKYRRAGIGIRAARDILQRYRGIWEINVAHYNAPAHAFWRKAVETVAGYRVQAIDGDGKRWAGPIFRLEPDAGAAAPDAAS